MLYNKAELAVAHSDRCKVRILKKRAEAAELLVSV